MLFASDVHRFDHGFGSRVISCYDSDPKHSRERSVVLLHGSGGTAASSFWSLQPMLSRKHRVLAFDFLDPLDEDSEDFFAAQAGSFVEAEHKRGGPIDLVGYSFGAVIAATVAAACPEIVRSLTLVAGWAKTDAQQLLRNDIWKSLYETGSEALGKYAVLTGYSQNYLNARTPAELSALIAANSNGTLRAAKMRFNRSVDLHPILDRIMSPALVVGCQLDQICPISHSHMLFGGIDNARLFEMHTGHGVVHERPSELAAIVSDFIVDPSFYPSGTHIQNEHA